MDSILGLIAVNSIEFARPLKSFRQSRSSIVIELDASLTGIGLLYYERSDTGEVLIAGGAIDISTLKFESEASFQNTAEFIAAVLGIRGLSQLGQQPESVCLRGDSMTALTWASTGRFKGELVCNAAAVFVLQNVYRKVAVNEIVHLAAENNWRADYLSRGGTMEGLLKRDSALRYLVIHQSSFHQSFVKVSIREFFFLLSLSICLLLQLYPQRQHHGSTTPGEEDQLHQRPPTTAASSCGRRFSPTS